MAGSQALSSEAEAHLEARESGHISTMARLGMHPESILDDTMIGATATAHAWRPLLDNATSQIRLLYLPRQTPGSDGLHVNLEVFRITDAPKCQALSYSWRSPFPDEHLETPSYHVAEQKIDLLLT
jgi:hypothetical protein